ncbi:hypothetical protein POTOM_054952 [Populus tomentosa]|uniref:Protein farnesyltransferase subunit beta n=1 Tax=Populus tomentosa TaxID=118781 RepID=A0A8X7Y1B4_POPTO|nr:hypothetical protein POTOM_054952 [Populus tomentosa]
MESGGKTVTQVEQWSVEDRVFRIYNLFANIPPGAQTTLLELQRDEHIKYLNEGLKQLGPSFVALDSSRPWLCYWIIHSMALLGESLDYQLENNAIDFLNRCQDPNGGFGGGPGQASSIISQDEFVLLIHRHCMPHLATTYAAVNSIVTLGGQKALSSINRCSLFFCCSFKNSLFLTTLQLQFSELIQLLFNLSSRDKLYNFLLQMKDPSGAFRMHDAGEIDVRACYTAISVASILNILDDELVRGVGNFILRVVESYHFISLQFLLPFAFMDGIVAVKFESEISMSVDCPDVDFCDNSCPEGAHSFVGMLQLKVFLFGIQLSCQTYEGGIAGEPGSEAHGGYTFCGLATMILINEVNHLDLAGLIDWVVFRQGVECGFQGRANKLVDGCYSFWQGGVLALLQRIDLVTGERLSLFDSGEEDSTGNSTSEGEDTDGISSMAEETCHFKNGEQQDASCSVNYTSSSHTQSLGNVEMEPLFHSLALQQYILLCSQVEIEKLFLFIDDPIKSREEFVDCLKLSGYVLLHGHLWQRKIVLSGELENGGFRDKPGKPRDFYHTCYCLSGLSVCQHSCSKDYDSPSVPGQVLGPYSNLLEPIHPLYNVVLKQYREVREFFSRS